MALVYEYLVIDVKKGFVDVWSFQLLKPFISSQRYCRITFHSQFDDNNLVPW